MESKVRLKRAVYPSKNELPMRFQSDGRLVFLKQMLCIRNSYDERSTAPNRKS